MGKEWNEFVIDGDKYETKEELATTLGTAIMMITEQENVCKIYVEDCNVYVIEYEHDDEHSVPWGGVQLEWLSCEEYETVTDNREAAKEGKSNTDT